MPLKGLITIIFHTFGQVVFQDYVDDIFETFVQSTEDDREHAAEALAEITLSHMDTMLEKQSKDESIVKRNQRKKSVIEDVPATETGELF